VVPPGRKNAMRRRQYRKFLEACVGENRFFGKMTLGEWSGNFYKQFKFPRRWSRVSQIEETREDWEREWPNLLARIEADQLEIIKRSASGDVLCGQVVIGGKPVDVIVKRPRRSKWYRYVTEIGRGGRSARAWKKAWSLVVRDVPTAWPMLVMEKRRLGYVVDSVIVLERVHGKELAAVDLDAMEAGDRQDLFRRLGRTLRDLESKGLNQYDSKGTNWIVVEDEKLGPVPVIVDVDGIRRWVPDMWPIDRLLSSMREHPQYSVGDSRELCLGYAPFARLVREREKEGSGVGVQGSGANR
jgi:tRNA A-37 threonylcarbamoyl transferase component Bud32